MKAQDNVNLTPRHREGSAKVAAALGLASFPIEKDRLESKVGEWKIPLGDGNTVPLRELLEAVPQDEFADHGQALNAIDLHWRDVVAKMKPEAERAPERPKKKATAPPQEQVPAKEAAEASPGEFPDSETQTPERQASPASTPRETQE